VIPFTHPTVTHSFTRSLPHSVMNMDGSSSNNNTQDVERKENQIFVRNLAYSTTSEDLMGLFEEFGPMKRATIVQKDGVSRGFGFVKFALEEDANAAVRALQGRELNGRAMKLEIAVQRGQSTKGGAGDVGANGGVEMNDEEKEASKSTPSLSVPNSLNTSNNHLQVIVTGVPTHINKKVFRDAVVKSLPFKCKKILIDLIKSDHEMYAQLCPESLIPAGRVMLLTVPSRQDVPKVVSHLDGMTVKALGLSTVSEEKGTEVKCKLTCRSLKDVTPVDSRKQKCRLILRNLSFQAVEENVATRLLKFGPLVEVSIPRIEVDHSKTEGGAKNGYAKNRFEKKQQQGQKQLKPRGFAFVMFLCEKDAASAVSGCEGLKICNREFALDFCQHKYGYGFANENEEEEGAKEDEEAKDEVKEDGDESGEDEGTSDSDADSADGSDDENDDDKSDSGSVDDDASDYSGEEMKVNDSDEESEPGSEMEWDGSDSDESDDEDESSKTKKSESASKKPVSTDVNEKRTVFVRDLAFDADQNDVKKVFRQFGPIEFAVIVLGTSRWLFCFFISYTFYLSIFAYLLPINSPMMLLQAYVRQFSNEKS
jgi:nucleolar protein 4